MFHFEQIPHTADVTVSITADSLKELFAGALAGMFSASAPRFAKEQKNTRTDRVSLTAPDTETLLVDFLSHALALSDMYNHAYTTVLFHSCSAYSLEADLIGVPVQGFTIEIKAVTYHDLTVTCNNGRYQASIVLDI